MSHVAHSTNYQLLRPGFSGDAPSIIPRLPRHVAAVAADAVAALERVGYSRAAAETRVSGTRARLGRDLPEDSGELEVADLIREALRIS